MPRKKNPSRHTSSGTSSPAVLPKQPAPSHLEQAFKDLRHPAYPFQTVSVRWLLAAASLSVLAAALCAWGALCYLFAQGSWQLLYHPSAVIVRTPGSANLHFETIHFAPDPSGVPQLTGWWIPVAPDAKDAAFVVLYLHGQDGNLSIAVDDLAFLHSVGLNIFAFDYRGYGQSRHAHPSEAGWREDATAALTYLVQTRHVAPNAIVVEGKNLGANLALEFAAAHPELAGVILDQPLDEPMRAVFNDPRAALVPAHLLARDRYDAAAASSLHIPSLWIESDPSNASTTAARSTDPDAYLRVATPKTLVWLSAKRPGERNSDSHDTAAPDSDLAAQRSAALSRWLDDLAVNPAHP